MFGGDGGGGGSPELRPSAAGIGDEKTLAVDGVEGRLQNLRLSDAEKKLIRIGKKQACSLKASKLQAVGKLYSEKPARAGHVGRALGNIWSPFSGVECKELGRNRFLFLFHEEMAKKKTIEGGPWMFDKDLIVTEEFMPSKTIDEYEFKTIPIWVRAYYVPMGVMSRETAEL